MNKTLLILIVFIFTLLAQTTFAQLAGCSAGCDTLVYDSKFNTQSDGWKVEPMNPIPAACGLGNGDRWEWGTPTRVASAICNNYTPPPIIPGQTKFWITELNGCFCNGATGFQDSMYIYKVIDLSSVSTPIRIEMVNWTDGCGPDRLGVAVNNTLIWDSYSGFPQGDRSATFWNTVISHPVLDAAVGTKNAVFTIIFFMTNNCNGEGGVVANFDVRACKASCGGGPTVPTLSEWGLLFLLLFFLSLGLILRKERRVAYTH